MLMARQAIIPHHFHSSLQAAWQPSLSQQLSSACTVGRLGRHCQCHLALHGSCHLPCQNAPPCRLQALLCSLHDRNGPKSNHMHVADLPSGTEKVKGSSMTQNTSVMTGCRDRQLLRGASVTPSGELSPLAGSSFSSTTTFYTTAQSLHTSPIVQPYPAGDQGHITFIHHTGCDLCAECQSPQPRQRVRLHRQSALCEVSCSGCFPQCFQY